MKTLNLHKFDSLYELTTHYKTDKMCYIAIAKARWQDDVVCPKCGKHHCKLGRDGRFYCTSSKCRHRFSALSGTIFENTKISLRKWFIALYQIASQTKGISSRQLAKNIKVSQKTAWYIKSKIMTLFAQDALSDTEKLYGQVEMDEMYLGGREINKHASKKTPNTQGRSTKTKSPIFGMIERDGIAVIKAVKDTTSKTLEEIIKAYVSLNSVVYTDELSSYNNLGKIGYNHKTVKHKAKEFAVGDINTNHIEGFWAEFKRFIFGTHHFVSKEHLQAYIDEQVYRFNTRELKSGKRFEMMFGASVGVIRYADIEYCKLSA